MPVAASKARPSRSTVSMTSAGRRPTSAGDFRLSVATYASGVPPAMSSPASSSYVPAGDEARHPERMRRAPEAQVDLAQVHVVTATVGHDDEVDAEGADDAFGGQNVGHAPRRRGDGGPVRRPGREAAAQIDLAVGATEDLVVGRQHLDRPARRDAELHARRHRAGMAHELLDDRALGLDLGGERRPRLPVRAEVGRRRVERRLQVGHVDDRVALTREPVVQLDHDGARVGRCSSTSADRARRPRRPSRGPSAPATTATPARRATRREPVFDPRAKCSGDAPNTGRPRASLTRRSSGGHVEGQHTRDDASPAPARICSSTSGRASSFSLRARGSGSSTDTSWSRRLASSGSGR